MADYSQLTDRQREIYDFIREKIESRGYGPTVREIGMAFGIQSPNGVMCHLKALQKKKMITRPDKPLARAIQLVDHRPPGAHLPMYGNVAAGPAIDAEPQQDESVDFNSFCGAENFALRVQGDSMINDHIEDGDLVVIKRQQTASNGERGQRRYN